MPKKQHHLSSNETCVQNCRQREVKRAVLSRAANLWPYLLDKSIEVSESRVECAVGELEGLTPGLLPPGPSWGVPACLFTLHLFCFSAPILQLLSHTHIYTWVQQSHVYFSTSVP